MIKAVNWEHFDDVMSQCMALLNGNQNMELWRGSDIGFSLCAVPTYYYVSKYFKQNTESGIQRLIQIEHSSL